MGKSSPWLEGHMATTKEKSSPLGGGHMVITSQDGTPLKLGEQGSIGAC